MKATRRTKIAVIVPKYGLVGGGERFASEITERLAQNNDLEFHVFANRWAESSNRIQFHKIPSVYFPRFLRPLFFAWFVKWKISRMNFDLVHTHHWIFKADIFSLHGTSHANWIREVKKKSPSLFDRALSAVERQAMKGGKLSCFLPVSTIALEAFHREYSTLPGQWQVVHPGVDVARRNPGTLWDRRSRYPAAVRRHEFRSQRPQHSHHCVGKGSLNLPRREYPPAGCRSGRRRKISQDRAIARHSGRPDIRRNAGRWAGALLPGSGYFHHALEIRHLRHGCA
jgi:glycosyltransferase involved in cell wall biosynthesis